MNQRERLAAALEDRRWSQYDLAKAIGVSQAAVAQWSTGRCRPRIDIGFRVAKALRVDPGWLWTGDTGNMIEGDDW